MTPFKIRVSLITFVLGANLVLPVSASQGRGNGGSPPPPPPPPPPVTLVNPTVSDCYSGAGCLDPAFGNLGKALMNIAGIGPNDGATIDAVGIQADGKLVAAGQALVGAPTTGDWSWVIGRFLTDGTIDASFGSGGFVSLNDSAAGSGEWPNELAIQPDGKILIAGTLGAQGPTVVRLNAAGTLDTTFGIGGKVALDLTAAAGVTGMALQPDGKIVVAVPNSGIGTYFQRLGTNGALDKTFGSKGTRLILNLSGGGDVKLQSTGRIVIAGGWDGAAVVARLTAAGDLDTTFGTKGMTSMDFGASDTFLAMSVGADDSIAAAGIALVSSTGNMVVGRMSSSGVPSASFGSNGRVVLDIFGTNDRANGVALQADGRVLFSGWAGHPTGTRKSAVVGRLLGTGALDTSFGAGGVTVTEFDPYMHIEPITMVTTTGEIILGGGVGLVASPPISNTWMLLRFFK